MEEGCDLRQVYLVGARSLYKVFMSKTAGSIDENSAKLLFAAMIGANLLNRFGKEEWIEDLKTAVTDAAEGSARTDSLGVSAPAGRPDVRK